MKSEQPMNAVYHLDINHYDPRIERFAGADGPPLLGERGHHLADRLTDFYPSRPYQPLWEPPRLAEVWEPLKVKGRIRAWNDFPMLMHIPAFSQRAVDALRDMLEPHGELLPLIYEHGTYWAYNLRTVVDIVDGRNEGDANL